MDFLRCVAMTSATNLETLPCGQATYCLQACIVAVTLAPCETFSLRAVLAGSTAWRVREVFPPEEPGDLQTNPFEARIELPG